MMAIDKIRIKNHLVILQIILIGLSHVTFAKKNSGELNFK